MEAAEARPAHEPAPGRGPPRAAPAPPPPAAPLAEIVTPAYILPLPPAAAYQPSQPPDSWRDAPGPSPSAAAEFVARVSAARGAVLAALSVTTTGPAALDELADVREYAALLCALCSELRDLGCGGPGGAPRGAEGGGGEGGGQVRRRARRGGRAGGAPRAPLWRLRSRRSWPRRNT